MLIKQLEKVDCLQKMETVKSNGRPAFTIDDILADERGQDCVDGSGKLKSYFFGSIHGMAFEQ